MKTSVTFIAFMILTVIQKEDYLSFKLVLFLVLVYAANILRPLVTKFCNKLETFVPGKPFQPSLMFVGKAVDHLSEAPTRHPLGPMGFGRIHLGCCSLGRM